MKAKVRKPESFLPLTPAMFHILLAMAVMILAERGRLSFDDSLTKFFPEFPAYANLRSLMTSQA